MVKAVTLAALGTAALAAGLASSSSATQSANAQSPSRVVDRTMVCASALSGGIHEVEIRVQGGAVRKGSRWEKPALVMTTTGSIGSAALALDNAIAWVVAGTPTAHANLVETVVGVPYPVNTWGTVAMSNRCTVSRARPALSSQGLRGGSVDPLGAVFDCSTPRRVLVRTRAVLTARTGLNNRRGYLGTTMPATEGKITIATLAGKRLAYAEVLASGTARLFTARGCIPD